MKFWIAIFVVLACGAFYGWYALFVLRGPAPIKFEGPPVKVTAEELSAAYQTNPQDADRRFKGKIVHVTGAVTGMDPLWPASGPLNVLMLNDLSIQCVVPEEKRGQFGPVQINDVITASGGCTGKGDGQRFVIYLVNCDLVERSPKKQ